MKERQERVPFWRSLQLKYAMTYILIIAAMLVLLNTYPVLASQNMVFQSKRASMQNQASFIASALAGPEAMTPDSVTRVMTMLDSPAVNRLVVTDPAGLVLYDTSEVDGAVGRYALFDEVVTALGGNDVVYYGYEAGAFHTKAAAPILYRGMIMGAVYLNESDTEQGALLVGVQQNLRSLSIVICLVALLLSVLFSKALTRRIGALLRAIRQVREGEYSHRVKPTGSDELTQLAQEFNELTGRLQTTDEVRRRFVSDASHELKTPLASIRLLTDSILQSEHMEPDTAREFLADIGEEAERLTRITERLLTLTRLDNAVETETAPVSLSDVVERVIHMLTPLTEQAQVAVTAALDRRCVVRATEDGLYQVVFNLVENGVKYNHSGGEVRVSTFLLDPQGPVILRVDDTGVGIPEEDLPKIFDRFYRVDKARSRAAGGTGLGLSIARDTVRQFGGSIAVSRLEQGSRFEVTLPLCRDREEVEAR